MGLINDDRLIGGVCAFLGKHTIIPTWLWRLMFIVTPGSSILYLILWLVVDV
jgi:phage shock protein PspC (stress-responsive transcriptional regulator)